MVGNRVQELRAQPALKALLQVVDIETVLIQRNGEERRLEASKRLDRAEVGRAFDDDEIAGVEERLGDQFERLDRAARDQQLVSAGAATLQRLEPPGEGFERARQAARRRVLERRRLGRVGELPEQRRDVLTRKRLRVGETARERDQVGQPE